jgi:hypothetical protein
MDTSWSIGSFTIALSKHAAAAGDTGRRQGYIQGNFGIYREGKSGRCWCLTHLPSGLRCNDYAYLEAAKQAAARLATLEVDWYSATPTVGLPMTVVAQIKALL